VRAREACRRARRCVRGAGVGGWLGGGGGLGL